MFHARPRSIRTFSATLLAVVAAVAVPAPPASASVPDAAVSALPANCAQPNAGGRVTCTFTGTGSEQLFTVPSAASSTELTMTVIGAAGGTSLWSGRGGIAVLNSFAFRAGTPLYVEVGTIGRDSTGVSPGGFNGGGAGAVGRSSGGGASDVRLVSRTRAASLASRFIVAGGGGGASGCASEAFARGGDAGENGSDGYSWSGVTVRDVSRDTIAYGGGAGTAKAGGAGGWSRSADPAGAGSFGQGGAGAMGSLPGCGGGGGWYGGGGSVQLSGAGGGSNFLLFPGVFGVARLDQPAGVTISYQPGGSATAVRAVPSVTRAPVGTWITLGVQSVNADGATLGDVSAKARADLGQYGICDDGAPRCKLTVPGSHAIDVSWFDPKARYMWFATVTVTAT